MDFSKRITKRKTEEICGTQTEGIWVFEGEENSKFGTFFTKIDEGYLAIEKLAYLEGLIEKKKIILEDK